ncbi:MAG: hypothetical protein R2874_05355 [Desulfobacterales bacterium]
MGSTQRMMFFWWAKKNQKVHPLPGPWLPGSIGLAAAHQKLATLKQFAALIAAIPISRHGQNGNEASVFF